MGNPPKHCISDTSLAMISASTRIAVLICAAPPLSANKPDRSELVGSRVVFDKSCLDVKRQT
jgi:hypothetical protein